MADGDAPPMHEEFARWYSVVSMGDDHARRQARWKGVSSVVKTAVRSTIETLLRLAHHSRQTPAAAEVQATGAAVPPASAGRSPRMQGRRRFPTLGGHRRCFALISLDYLRCLGPPLENTIRRVEMWRGGVRLSMSVPAPFVWRCLSGLAVAPFPHPAHRTGRADFPHPALGQDLTPSVACDAIGSF